MGQNRKLISIDTNQEWIAHTNKTLQRLNCTNYLFVPWEQWSERTGPINLDIGMIFNDGHIDLREQFGLDAWPLLDPGGFMIFHDTRHISIVRNITKLIETYHNEIREVEFNEKWHGVASNLTVLHKKKAEPYVNWNHVEQKPLWRYGHPEFGPTPDSYWDQ